MQTAETTAAASRVALEALTAQRDDAQLELRSVDAEVAALADAVLGQEAEAQAAEIIRDADAVIAKGRRLRASVPQGAHVPVNEIRLDLPSPTIERALEITRRIQVGADFHTRLDVVRGLTDDVSDERAALAAHRAALIEE